MNLNIRLDYIALECFARATMYVTLYWEDTTRVFRFRIRVHKPLACFIKCFARNNAGYRASDHNEARMSSSAQFYIIPSHCASCHAPLIKMSTLTMGKQAWSRNRTKKERRKEGKHREKEKNKRKRENIITASLSKLAQTNCKDELLASWNIVNFFL